MPNFLQSLGAAFQGVADYDVLQQKKAAQRLEIDAGKQRLAEITDLADLAKKQRAREGDVNKTVLDYLAQNSPQGLPPVPPPNAPVSQPPAPGQQSVPYIDPSKVQAPGGPQPSMPPQGMGMPPVPGMPQQAPQMAPQAPQMPPPYQTVSGANAQPQQAAMGIPPPPQQMGQPRPNSMSLQDAAHFIQSKGITDPTTGIQVLEKLSPYLNSEAKQEAQMLKLQLEQTNKLQELEFKKQKLEQDSQDRQLGIKQREAAAKDANGIRMEIAKMTNAIAQQNANTRAADVKAKIASGTALSKEDYDLMADQVLSGDKSVFVGLGRSPKDIAGVRAAVTRKAKEQGLTGADLSAAVAGFEGVKAGERTLGTRTANIGLAGNEAALFAQNALEASNKVNRTEYPSLNKVLEAWRKGTGDTAVTDLASYTNSLINAYARAVSPSGTPTVSDKDHAREILSTAFTKGQYESAINVILKEIEAAKASPGQTKDELRSLFKGDKHGAPAKAPAAAAPVFSNAAELQAAIKSGKIKKGQTFTDPSGASHVVN